MLRQVIAITAALLMAIPMLSGCTSGAPGDTTGSGTTAGVTSGKTETTALSQTGKNLCPYNGETVTLEVFAAEVGVKEDVNSPVYQIYKKAVGNIDIKWDLVPLSDLDTKAKLYLNSGDIPDVMWYKSPDLMLNYASSGLFLDLKQYQDYMPNWTEATQNNPGLLMYQTVDGKQYIMQGIDNDYPGEGFFANMTVLNKCGITSVPTTLSEMEAAMQKVREADPSVTPFHTIFQIDYYMGVFGASLNARTNMYFDLSDKKWKFALLTPESKYKELITLMADYYKKGYFNPEFSTMSGEQSKQLIASNKWAFTFAYATQLGLWYDVDSNGKFPVEIEPFLPVAAEGVKPNIRCAYTSDSPYWGYSASAKVKNPELTVSWMDMMLSDEVATAFQWGVEGTSYTQDANGKKSWVKEFVAKGDQASKDLGIWNILAPRYITKRDDSSMMQKYHPVDQKMVKLQAEAIKNGTIDSYYYRANPKFTEDESEELSSIMTPVQTKMAEGQAQFILGKRSMSEWDNFVNEVKSLGNIERAVEIYNNAIQSPDRLQGKDRDYVTP